MIESLPPAPSRRGILVAIEGPPLSGKTHLINKIADKLGKVDEDVVLYSPTLDLTGKDYSDKTIMFIDHIITFRELGEKIEKALKEKKCVIVESYVMQWLAYAYRSNLYQCQHQTVKRGFKKLAKPLHNLPVPDLVLYVQPNTDTLVQRYITAGTLTCQDDYIFSEYRRLVEAYEKLIQTGILENVCPMLHDPITKESDAINLITMRAAMDMNAKPIRYF